MNVFIVYLHPEPKSFNAAMFSTACKVLAETGAEAAIPGLLKSHIQSMYYEGCLLTSILSFRSV
jgi:putative NADPH-quinone reductase